MGTVGSLQYCASPPVALRPDVAAGDNTNSELVRTLFEAVADLESRDRNTETALMHAAERNTNPAVAQVLIDAGGDIEIQDRNHWMPLMNTVRWNTNPAEVQVLVDAAANVEPRWATNFTALGHRCCLDHAA